MKKTITILLAIFILLTLLTACSQLMGDALKEPDEPSPPIETPEGGDKPEPEPTEPEPEPEPTGVDEYGFTIWPEGNYLADPKFDTDEYLPDFDVDPSFISRGRGVMCSTVTSTEDSIYVFHYDFSNYDNIIWYTDKTSGLTMPLCGKPECTHKEESCNAVAGYNGWGLGSYDGMLYWVTNAPVSSNWTVKRMALDGTDHADVARVEASGLRFVFGGENSAFIHRGYAYFSGVEETVAGGKPQFVFRVLAQPLNGGETVNILEQAHEMKSTASTYCYVVPSGNDLYIVLTWIDPANESAEDKSYHLEVYRYSTKTRKAQRLCAEEDLPWNFSGYNSSYPVATAEGIYFLDSKFLHPDDVPDYVPDYVTDRGVQEGTLSTFTVVFYSFETGTIEELSSAEIENARVIRLVPGHILCCHTDSAGELVMAVYDYEWNLLFQSAPMPEHLTTLIDIGGEDEGYIFVLTNMFGPVRGGTQESFIAIPKDGGEVLVLDAGRIPQKKP